MTDTHTLAWRRSGVTSTSVIVRKPMRGSSTSRADDLAYLFAQQLIEARRSLIAPTPRRPSG